MNFQQELPVESHRIIVTRVLGKVQVMFPSARQDPLAVLGESPLEGHNVAGHGRGWRSPERKGERTNLKLAGYLEQLRQHLQRTQRQRRPRERQQRMQQAQPQLFQPTLKEREGEEEKAHTSKMEVAQGDARTHVREGAGERHNTKREHDNTTKVGRHEIARYRTTITELERVNVCETYGTR